MKNFMVSMATVSMIFEHGGVHTKLQISPIFNINEYKLIKREHPKNLFFQIEIYCVCYHSFNGNAMIVGVSKSANTMKMHKFR